jgi:peptidase M50B-like protein
LSLRQFVKSKRFFDIYTTLLILLAVFFLWNTLVTYPLKILVVFFHESSHGIATILTGGKILAFELVPQAGGHVVSAGGNRFVTLTAGYLGSLLWGVAIFYIAVSSLKDRLLMGGLGVLLLAITLLFASNSFAMLFGISTGVAMLLSSKYLSIKVNDFLLRVIGLTSMMYVPLDIYSDTIQRSYLPSDAFMLAQEFGGTTMLWGGVWLMLSIFTIFYSLRRLFRAKK